MKKVNLLAAAVVVAASFSMSSAYASGTGASLLHGDISYFRTGVASRSAYSSQDENLVGRLGNQFDTYIELAPNVTLNETDGTQWDFVTSVAYKSKVDGNFTDLRDQNSTDLALTQGYLRVKGLFDIDPDAVLWAGKKYNREDSHLVDQYWRNISGNGVGIENISLGSGKFSAHWVKNDIKDQEFQKGNRYFVTDNKVDVAYAFPVGPGNLELRYTRIMPQRYSSSRGVSPVKDYENGNLFAVKFGMPVLNGWNNTVLRYAKGGNANWAGAAYGNDLASSVYGTVNSNAYAWDLMNFGAVNFTDRFHMLYHVRGTYADRKTVGEAPKSKMFQAVLRPVYVLTKMTKFMVEGGYYTLTGENVDGSKFNQNIGKLTLAYAVNPDAYNAWTRPEIRFYATYKHYGHESMVPSYMLDWNGGDNNQYIFGVQAEAWF